MPPRENATAPAGSVEAATEALKLALRIGLVFEPGHPDGTPSFLEVMSQGGPDYEH